MSYPTPKAVTDDEAKAWLKQYRHDPDSPFYRLSWAILMMRKLQKIEEARR